MKLFDKKNMTKSVIYRLYAFIITFIVAFLVTGNIELSATIGVVENAFKILTYYWFDIFWDKFTKTKYRTSLIWMTGLSGAGKTTMAKALVEKLQSQGHSAMVLDGDEIRDIFKNNGFDKEARVKHNQDVGKMAVYLQSQGIIPIVSLISPYAEARDYVRGISKDFTEVYVSTSINECERRDVKGLYKKVRSGEIKDFTGIHDSAPYEAPKNPEINLDTQHLNVDDCVNNILKYIKK
jgi:adenylylsulfate kinase